MLKIIDGTGAKIIEIRGHIDRYGKPLKPYWPAIFFVGGFFFDIFTLGRIDSYFNILTHALYLLLILAALLTQILELQPSQSGGRLVTWFFTYRNEGVHFLLGALLNSFVIFFFKSGTFANTIFLLVLLAALLVINEMEFFRSRGAALKMVLFNISLCCFMIYLLPLLLGHISSGIFLLSLGCALLVNLAVWQLLAMAGIGFVRLRQQILLPALAAVLGFAVLYGARMIPPVPLSLLQIGIYHDLERQDGSFRLFRETPAWQFWAQGDRHFLARDGDRLFLFCRIFAPGGFRDQLYFRFQRYEQGRGWKSTDRIPLTIVGGRAEGFRGYAYKNNYQVGRWRALVETTDELEIGRINFRIERSGQTQPRKFYEERY